MFGRAFSEAYRQAAQQTAKQGAASSTRAHDNGITLDESAKILDIDLKSVTLDKIDERYNKLFDINSKEKADSFYLQSKIHWAAERLRNELKAKAEEAQEAQKSDSPAGNSGKSGSEDGTAGSKSPEQKP